jgi:hypothetical protein
VTAMAERYVTAAELLRRLASRPDRLIDNGDNGDGGPVGLAEALKVAVHACEQVDKAERARGDAELACEEALLGAVHLWSLLERAAEVVDAHIARDDGGAWETLTLAFELHQAVQAEPDELGERLLGELHAARVALRAAEALAGAVQRGQREVVAVCLAGFQQASRAWKLAAGTCQHPNEVGGMVQGARP